MAARYLTPARAPVISAGDHSERGPWPRRTAALFMLAGLLVGTASPARSAPAVSKARDDLRRAKAQLTALNVQLSLLAEQIHAGKVLLKTIRHDLAAAKRKSERTRLGAAPAAHQPDATGRGA